VYTRKSTEEGLDQEFNSLDAQREAAEAYIKSQRHQGWALVSERYDDGGFTGANLDRPALKRLLEDVDAQRIHATILVILPTLNTISLIKITHWPAQRSQAMKRLTIGVTFALLALPLLPLVSLLLVGQPPPAGGLLQVHILDVGQADAIYLECPDPAHHNMLIDSGDVTAMRYPGSPKLFQEAFAALMGTGNKSMSSFQRTPIPTMLEAFRKAEVSPCNRLGKR
jgi:hypothetical protein